MLLWFKHLSCSSSGQKLSKERNILILKFESSSCVFGSWFGARQIWEHSFLLTSSGSRMTWMVELSLPCSIHARAITSFDLVDRFNQVKAPSCDLLTVGRRCPVRPAAVLHLWTLPLGAFDNFLQSHSHTCDLLKETACSSCQFRDHNRINICLLHWLDTRFCCKIWVFAFYTVILLLLWCLKISSVIWAKRWMRVNSWKPDLSQWIRCKISRIYWRVYFLFWEYIFWGLIYYNYCTLLIIVNETILQN